MNSDPRSSSVWDGIAARYDERADQGLADPSVRQAWQRLFEKHLPGGPRRILDAGCGTGSLSLLLTEMGHDAMGIDFSPEMVRVAGQKAEALGMPARFAVMDASAPVFPAQSFDAVICRQVLWALPDPGRALANWCDLLGPEGLILLIEGRFASGNGMSVDEVVSAMPDQMTVTGTHDIAKDIALWGGPIPDQRILVVARRKKAGLT